MKKIIIFLSVLLINISIQALEYDTYYSDYGDFSDYIEEEIIGDDLKEVEIETRYKWYKEIKEGDYLKRNTSYKYVDYDRYTYSDFSEWMDNADYSDDKLVETRNIYYAKKIKPINRILIQEFDIDGSSVNIESIKIYYQGNEIDYKIRFLDRKTNIGVSKDLFLFIDLEEDYYLSDLNIEIVSNEFNRINSFTIYALRTTEIKGTYLIFYTYDFEGSNSNVLNLSTADFTIINPSYEKDDILYTIEDTKDYDVVDTITQYRYRDKLYYFYNIRREYADGYYKNLDGYLKDNSNYKLYYRYKSRDKIEVADEIIIDSYDVKLTDLVKSTTNYEIDSNINYYKNGKYYVKYITDFIEVEREVIVDIIDNDIRESINNLNQQYNNLQKEYDKLLLNYNLKVNENKILNNNISLLNNKVDEFEKVYTNINNKKIVEEEKLKVLEAEKDACLVKFDDNEKKLRLSDQANKYLENSLLDINKEDKIVDFKLTPFIMLGIIILLITIIIIKKIRKN